MLHFPFVNNYRAARSFRMVEEMLVACPFGDPGLVSVQAWLGCKVPADREDWPVGNSSRVDIPGGEICIVPSAGLFRIDKA